MTTTVARGGCWRAIPAGAELSGLNWGGSPPGRRRCPPPHLHRPTRRFRRARGWWGTLELWPSPQRVREGVAYEEKPTAVLQPRARLEWIAHGSFRAGEGGDDLPGQRHAQRERRSPYLNKSLCGPRVASPGSTGLRRTRAANAGGRKSARPLNTLAHGDSCAATTPRRSGAHCSPRNVAEGDRVRQPEGRRREKQRPR